MSNTRQEKSTLRGLIRVLASCSGADCVVGEGRVCDQVLAEEVFCDRIDRGNRELVSFVIRLFVFCVCFCVYLFNF